MNQDAEIYFDRRGAPIDEGAYLRLRADSSYRIVAQQTVGDVLVATVWFGTDQGAGSSSGGPRMFGTAGLVPGGAGDLIEDFEAFASTEEDAMRNHRDLVSRVASSRA